MAKSKVGVRARRSPSSSRPKSAADRSFVRDVVGGFSGQPYYPPHFDPRSAQDWFSSWVYVAAKANATAVSRGRLRMYSRGRPHPERRSRALSDRIRRHLKTSMSHYVTEDTEEIVDHPFLRLMEYINPILDRIGLLYLTVLSLQMSGNSYWKLCTDDLDRPCELWWLPSHRVNPVLGESGLFDSYRFHHRQGYTDYPANEVVHFRWPSPISIEAGHGCLQGVYFSAEINKRMEEYENALFTNDCSVGVFISPEDDLTESQRVSLETAFIQRYAGWRNAGRPLIAPTKMSVQRMSESVRDLQFPEGRKFQLDQLAAGFGVPVPVILQDAAKYSNMRHGLYLWTQHTIAPIMMGISETLNSRLMPMYDDGCCRWDEFDLDRRPCKWFVCFDDPVPDDVDADVKNASLAYAGGVITRNEARAVLGYSSSEGGDDFLVPSGVRTQEEIRAHAALAESQARNPFSRSPSPPDSGKSAGRGEVSSYVSTVDSEAESAGLPVAKGGEGGGGGGAGSSAVRGVGVSGVELSSESHSCIEEDRRRFIEVCADRHRRVFGKLSEADVAPPNGDMKERIEGILSRWREWALALFLIGDMTPLTSVPEFAVHELSRAMYDLYMSSLSRGRIQGAAEAAEAGGGPVSQGAESVEKAAREMTSSAVSRIVESRTEALRRGYEDSSGDPVWPSILAVAFSGIDGMLSSTIFNTEYARGICRGAIDAYTESGIEYKMWISQAGACEYCAALHGSVSSVNEPFKTGWVHDPEIPSPPLHPNCRCAVAAAGSGRVIRWMVR